MGLAAEVRLYFSETSLSPHSTGHHGYNLDTLAVGASPK